MLPRSSTSDAVLDYYAKIAAAQRPRDIEETALRTRSLGMRDLLARLASTGRHRFDDLRTMTDEELAELEPRWAAALGRVTGLQGLEDHDYATAVRLLTSSTARLTESARRIYRRNLAELLYASGRLHEVHTLLTADPVLRELRDGYLLTDLLNPFTESPFADENAWLERFGEPFRRHDLAPPLLARPGAFPFDRLTAERTGTVHEEPLVTVVMTRYATPREPLLTSVRSILEQSWQNLELVLVDDCSPDGGSFLDELEALDERVRVIRMTENGGTYLARNAGIEAARGVFVTGQDDDDWSHPDRIARQVAPLLADKELPASRSRCITVNDHLVMLRPGYDPVRPNASSLMFRADTARRLGGFLPSRRGADSEFQLRLEHFHETPTLDLPEPLSLVRIRTDSLSRGDFRPGWHHPARRAFRSAYLRWHATTPSSELEVTVSDPPVPVPTRFSVQRENPLPFDVIIASDWRSGSDASRALLTETSLWPDDWRIGLLQLDSPHLMPSSNIPLWAPIQDLVNKGAVTHVMEDDEVATALLLIGDPAVLQFPPAEQSRIEAAEVIIVADHAPSGASATDAWYDARECSGNGAALFGREPRWLPTRGIVRDALGEAVETAEILSDNLRSALDPRSWMTEREFHRADRPVIGHHAPDIPSAWPHASVFHTVYPNDGTMELRRLGSVRWARHNLGGGPLSPHWVVFTEDEIDARTFLSSLDFFVYYPSKGAGPRATVRAIGESLAAGCVAVLPPEFRRVFGEAAVYAPPERAPEQVWSLYDDPGAYRAAVERALAWSEDTFRRALKAQVIPRLRAQVPSAHEAGRAC